MIWEEEGAGVFVNHAFPCIISNHCRALIISELIVYTLHKMPACEILGVDYAFSLYFQFHGGS
jgi:hypothetical protein